MTQKSRLTIVVLTLLVSVFIASCGGSTAVVSPTTEAETTLDGKAVLDQRCTACHTLDRVERTSKSPAEWGMNVRRMVSKGAELNASEQEVLIEYLSLTYP